MRYQSHDLDDIMLCTMLAVMFDISGRNEHICNQVGNPKYTLGYKVEISNKRYASCIKLIVLI